jgi:ribose transport system ATP-binding protein
VSRPVVLADASVSVRRLSKSYGSLRVLKEVDFTAARGRVHAVLGANGSGKSTLVKILGSVERYDSGSVTVFGRPVGSRDSRDLGLRIVHQHAPLIASQSISEATAMAMGYPVTRYGRIKWKQAKRTATQLCTAFHVGASPDSQIGSLGATSRALLALGFALHDVGEGPVALVLDEATASLPEHEASRYLTEVRRLADAGAAVIMVTHRLREVLDVADDVSVLAGGCVTAEGAVAEFDEERLAAAITALPVAQTGALDSEQATVATRESGLDRVWAAADRPSGPRIVAAPGTPAMRVENLGGRTIENLSFTVDPGEVLGVVGLAGSGREELPLLLGNVTPRISGSVWIGGTLVEPRAGPKAAIAAGLGLLPADRLQDGGAVSLRIDENLLMPDYRRYWNHAARARAAVSTAMTEFQVRGGTPRTSFGELSGGNQQKVILAKWLLTSPVVLVLDDPTQGVDPGSRRMIFELIRAAAASGVAVILFSTEPAQIAQLCRRVIVLGSSGASELRGADLTPEAVTRLAAI